MADSVRILVVGAVVGGLGRRSLLALLPGLRERLATEFVVDDKNVAGELGITSNIARALRAGCAGRRPPANARLPLAPR